MSPLPWALEALSWAAAPLGGALMGLAAGRVAVRLIPRMAAGVIPRLSADILEKPLAQLFPNGPDALARPIQKSVDAALHGLISSAWFLHEVRQSAARIVSSICALSVADLLARLDAKGLVVDRFLSGLSQGESRRGIAQAAGAALGKRLETLVSDDVLDRISRVLGRLLPVVIERLIEWLESVEMRQTMAERGRDLLPRVLEKLNLMQRFLLSAGQFDKRIDEKMPEIVDETLESLERIMRDPAQQRAMRDRILLAVRDWRGSNESRKEASVLVTELVDRFLERLQEPAARESAYLSFEGALTANGQNLGGLLRQRLGLRDSEIADSLANFILIRLSRPETAAVVSGWIAGKASDFLRENGASPLGRVLGIDARRKERIDVFLTETTARLAASSGLAAAAPARRFARRWTGLFGSVLGLLVGLLEDALRLLGIV